MAQASLELLALHQNNQIGVAGVAGEVAQIMALNVHGVTEGQALTSQHFADSIDIINATYYAVDNGADIINMSFGSASESDLNGLTFVIEYAISKGVLIVVAAGNNGLDFDGFVSYPANIAHTLDGLLSVGATLSDSGNLASYSSYDPVAVEITAPGSDSRNFHGVLTTAPNQSYTRLDGTSFCLPNHSRCRRIGYIRPSKFIWLQTLTC